MKLIRQSLSGLLALSLATSANAAPPPGEPITVSLNNPELITGELLPTMAKKVARNFNMDIFNFEIPAPEDFREELFEVLGCGAVFKLDLRTIYGSVGVDRDSFAWEFSQSPAGVYSDLSFSIPSRLATKTRLEVLLDCLPNQHLIYNVELKGLEGKLSSELSLVNGRMNLAPAGTFKLRPSNLSLNRVGDSIAIGVLLSAIDIVADLVGAPDTDDLIEMFIMQEINTLENQSKLKTALYDAINKSLAEPLTFEEEVFFGNIGLDVSANIASIAHAATKGMSVTSNISVDGGGAAACAANLLPPARVGIKKAHAVAGDLSIEVPYNLINSTVHKVVRQGALCINNKEIQVLCNGDDLNRAIIECLDSWDADPRSCSEVLGRHIGGGEDHIESLYVNLGFSGAPVFSRLANSNRGLAVTLPIYADVMFAGLPVARVKGKVAGSGELQFLGNKATAIVLKGDAFVITQLEQTEAVDAALCGLDQGTVRRVLENELKVKIRTLAPITLSPNLKVGGDWEIALDAARATANSWSIQLPLNVSCTGADCVAGVEKVYNCHSGVYSQVKGACITETLPVCNGTGVVVDRLAPVIGARAIQDICGEQGFGGGAPVLPRCAGVFGQEYVTRIGSDICLTPSQPYITYKEVEQE